MAVVIPWAGVLVAGDYLSPVEIPMLSPGGSLSAYEATLDRLQALIARSEWIVPGHGAPLARDAAVRVLEQDAAYLAALGAGDAEARLPEGRRTARQREVHLENMSRLR